MTRPTHNAPNQRSRRRRREWGWGWGRGRGEHCQEIESMYGLQSAWTRALATRTRTRTSTMTTTTTTATGRDWGSGWWWWWWWWQGQCNMASFVRKQPQETEMRRTQADMAEYGSREWRHFVYQCRLL